MKLTKMSLKSLKHALDADEMKKIMAGSTIPGPCGVCTEGDPFPCVYGGSSGECVCQSGLPACH